MKKAVLALTLLAVVALLGATGCKSKSGSREFIPGKGWKAN